MRNDSARKNIIWSGAAAAAVVAAITLNVRAGSPALPGIVARGRQQATPAKGAPDPAVRLAEPTAPTPGRFKPAVLNPFSAEKALTTVPASERIDLKKHELFGPAATEPRHGFSTEEVSQKSLK